MKSLKLSTNTPDLIEVPSKTFLWGEYSALHGGTAAVVTTFPCFAFASEEIKESENQEIVSQRFEFHPKSPAGSLIEYCQSQNLIQDLNFLESLKTCYMYDPFCSTGGFGRSTAEFAYVYQRLSLRLNMDVQSLWMLYRKLVNKKTLPSGYDLVSQMQPGFNLLSVQDDQIKIHSMPWPFTRFSFLIFKTQNQIKTHEHLDQLEIEKVQFIKQKNQAVSHAYLQQDWSSFIQRQKELNEALHSIGLVCQTSLDIISSLRDLEGVVLARGCGALGADVVAVFCKKQYKEQVINSVKSQLSEHLSFVADEDQILGL